MVSTRHVTPIRFIQKLAGVIVGIALVGIAANAVAASIQIGLSADDASGGLFGAPNPLSNTSVIQTHVNPAVTPNYDAGVDVLLDDSVAGFPGIDSNHVFVIYSPLGDSPAITNVDFNHVPAFQNGNIYTKHISLRDGVGIGAFVDLDIDLLDLTISGSVSYSLSMDTDGDRVFDSFASGNLSDIGEGGSLWTGTVFVPMGVDVRDASTVTGYSEHFGELTLTLNSVTALSTPEPSTLMSLIIGGICVAPHLARKRRSLSQKQRY